MWTKQKVKQLPYGTVRDRLWKEVTANRLSPVTGSYQYWKSIVEAKSINYQKQPQRYRIGKGEQGVLSTQPYTGIISAFWRFKTEADAVVSADMIFYIFGYYVSKNDFVGADIAKKFLQMGFTRARRYANFPSGRKYNSKNRPRKTSITNMTGEKANAALVFQLYWEKARTHPKFLVSKSKFLKQV